MKNSIAVRTNQFQLSICLVFVQFQVSVLSFDAHSLFTMLFYFDEYDVYCVVALCVHADLEQQLSSPGQTVTAAVGGYSLPTSDPSDPNAEDVVLFGSSVNEPIDSKSVCVCYCCLYVPSMLTMRLHY